MDTLHVHRLRARYRLPAGGAGERARLDRVLREALDEALEPALSAAGVPAHQEVCIRSVDAPARLRLGEADSTLAAAWSAALAGAIRATLDAGGANVARYGTRAHALVDLLAGVAAGDHRRAWAWRQLGLWSASDHPSAAAAAEEAAYALAAEAQLAPAALAEAARLGALPGLAARITPAGWSAAARAALRALGLPVTAVVALCEPDRPDSPPPAPGEPAARAARRVLRASAIARAASRIPLASAETRRALAVLATLEAEPSALARRIDVSETIVTEVDREIESAASVAHAGRSADADRRTDRDRDRDRTRDRNQDRELIDRDRDQDRADALPDRGKDRSASTEDDRSIPREDGDRSARERGDAHPDDDPRVFVGEMEMVGEMDGGGSEEDEERPVPEVRQAAWTRWGGLLFLVHVIDRAGLPAEIAADEALATRPLRWVLHRLATALLGLDERDPAALAFCGLGPERDPPTRGEPAATEEEDGAVARIARRIESAAYEAVRREIAPDARAAAALLRDLCRRSATIAADPGWIDVNLSLDEVSVDARRAGLDLDPGWIPWLGVVVRFVYA